MIVAAETPARGKIGAVDARPGSVVELDDGSFGVLLSGGCPMPGSVAIDLWHGGAVIVSGDEEVWVMDDALSD